jgi:hypothetical protein
MRPTTHRSLVAHVNELLARAGVLCQVLYAPLPEPLGGREDPRVACTGSRDVLVHVGHEVSNVRQLLRE